MNLVRPLWAVFCLIFPGLSLSAATVSFLVIETGLEEEKTAEASAHWESGLMDVFFEEGHVVSNAPIKRLAQKPETVFPEEARADFNDAREGGADFFILALLDYRKTAEDPAPKPQGISLRLFRVNPYQFIVEQRHSGGSSAPVSEEFITARNAARAMVSHIKDR
ncbi:MAG: hypothetical protein LBP32_03050 [Spirochaetaceae bacterium]|jgi:hypothetical protein|nr:hypothetical protein [Spirochaetaceae bacterium]